MKKTFDALYPDIKNLLKTVQACKSQKMTEYGLKGSTVQSLCCIARAANGLNANELSDALKIDKAQVSRCMAELGEKGLVFRDEQEGKQYRQKYRLTQKGSEVASDIAQTSRGIREKIRAGVSNEELDRFFTVLEALCENALAISVEDN